MDYLTFLGRISVCFILGIIIGLERQYRRKIAGIRTIALVSLGSFLFVSISDLTPASDITRIAAQVVSGIGFLGAGVIIRDGQNIRGLNTAATLWCSAAVGTLTALGFIIEAVIGVLYILASNIILRIISKKMMNKIPAKQIEHYSLTILCDEEKEEMTVEQAVKYAKALVSDGISKSDAAKIAAKEFGYKKGDVTFSYDNRFFNISIEKTDVVNVPTEWDAYTDNNLYRFESFYV